MRYILDVSGHDLKLIRASIVNFQRSLELSNHAEFDNLIDDLDECFLRISRIKKDHLRTILTILITLYMGDINSLGPYFEI